MIASIKIRMDIFCRYYHLTGLMVLLAIVSSCSSIHNVAPNHVDQEPCIVFDPMEVMDYRFNPAWIRDNKVTKVIQSAIQNDDHTAMSTVVGNFRTDGYLDSKVISWSAPTRPAPDLPRYTKYEYSYQSMDSFLIQESRIYYLDSLLNKVKEVTYDQTFAKATHTRFYSDTHQPKILTHETYSYVQEYDKYNRIVSVFKDGEKPIVKISYPSANKILVDKLFSKTKEYTESEIYLNERGQIIKRKSAWLGQHSWEFNYNDSGELTYIITTQKKHDPIRTEFQFIRSDE